MLFLCFLTVPSNFNLMFFPMLNPMLRKVAVLYTLLWATVSTDLQAQIVFEQESNTPNRQYYRFVLYNGDICAGYILYETDREIALYTDTFGEIKVNKESITKTPITNPHIYVQFYNRHEVAGKLVDLDKNRIIVLPQEGNIPGKSQNYTEIRRDMAEKIVIVTPDRIKRGKYWHPTEMEYMHLLRQTAFPLAKEQVMLKSQLTLLSIQYGITERLSAGIGSEVITLLAGLTSLTANVKYSIPLNKITQPYQRQFKLAFNASSLFLINNRRNSFLSGGSIGLAETIFTIGNSDHHLSTALGAGITSENNQLFSFRLGGTTRIERKTLLMGEFLHLNASNTTENLTAILAGFRFLSKRTHLDIALASGATFSEPNTAFPYFGLHVPIK